MERIGVFGGTFDPPHWGHIRFAETAYLQLELDKILWVPTGQPPHKQHRQPQLNRASLTATAPFGQMAQDRPSPAHHRMAMTLLVIAENHHFELSLLDMHRPGPHYTADLLSLLRQQHGMETLFWFLVGEDSLRELSSWHNPKRILNLCRLAVFSRSGPPVDWDNLEKVVPGIRSKVDWLDAPPIELASSAIRRNIRQGQPIDDYVPEAVGNYIVEQEVYRINWDEFL